MELSKNIFFNTDKLIENTVVKISYTAKGKNEADSKPTLIQIVLGA